MEYTDWYLSRKVWLCNHTPNIDDLMLHLHAKRLLSNIKKSEIEEIPGLTRKCQALYDHLIHWGDEQIEGIITCLKESENYRPADVFREFRPAKTYHGLWFEVGSVVYNFTGRGGESKDLHDKLDQSRADPKNTSPVCITGLGGVGKSALARNYAFEFDASYDGNVIWIVAKNLETIRQSFVRLGMTRLGLTDTECAGPDDEIAKKVYEKFKENKSLFIFDDVKQLEDILPFLYVMEYRCHSRPSILVTSRRRDLVLLPKNQLHLPVLRLGEAVALIKKQVVQAQPSTEETVQRLAKTMNGLPLALQQAVSYIRYQYGLPQLDNEAIEVFLSEFSENEQKLLSDMTFKKDVGDYEQTTFEILNETLETTKREGGEPVHTLISALTCLHPDVISLEFLDKFSPCDNARERLITRSSLARFSMVNISGRFLTIHRLVQRVIRLRLGGENQVATNKLVAQCLAEELRRVPNSPCLTVECKLHGRHILQSGQAVPDLGQLAQPSWYLLKDEQVLEQFSDLFQHVFGNEFEGLVRRLREAEAYHHEGGGWERLEWLIDSATSQFTADIENVLRFMPGPILLQ